MDRTKTKDEIIKECRRKGWIGPIIIWQYASDGDINLDGAKDGLSLGMESEDMDLDAWIGLSETNSAEDIIKEWSLYLGGTAPINNQPDTPVITVPDATFKTMIVASPFGDGLNIRNKPKNINGVTEKWMPQGTLVTILETVKYNNDIWHRIGFDQWCAETYNNITYLKG